jgi:hypothetical protein
MYRAVKASFPELGGQQSVFFGHAQWGCLTNRSITRQRSDMPLISTDAEFRTERRRRGANPVARMDGFAHLRSCLEGHFRHLSIAWFETAGISCTILIILSFCRYVPAWPAIADCPCPGLFTFSPPVRHEDERILNGGLTAAAGSRIDAA